MKGVSAAEISILQDLGGNYLQIQAGDLQPPQFAVSP